MSASREPVERPVEGATGAPPLYLPELPFPPYRFVPGHAPHPVAHAGGYRHGLVEEKPPFVGHATWQQSEAYLRGCDFFNRGWWWEAHEIWEALWHVVDQRDPAFRALLQGLIQLAACALNRERGVDTGAERLLETACAYLERAEDATSDGMLAGLDLPALRARARAILGAPCERVDGLYVEPA